MKKVMWELAGGAISGLILAAMWIPAIMWRAGAL